MYFHMLVQVRFSFEKFFTSLTLKSRIFEVCRVLRLRLNQILLYFGLNQILCVNNRGYLLFSWTFLNSVMNRTFISNQLFTVLFLQFLISNKVENILKGSLDLIPSPSVKIDIMGGKFAWDVKAKHCWVMSTNFWKQKVFLTSHSNVLPYYPTFPPIIWIFTEGEGDGIKSFRSKYWFVVTSLDQSGKIGNLEFVKSCFEN